MIATWIAALLTGVFGIAGALGGAALTGSINLRLESSKKREERARTWIDRRRDLYVRLALKVDYILRIAAQARSLMEVQRRGKEEDDRKLTEKIFRDIYVAWDDGLLPLVEEVRLATSSIAVLRQSEAASDEVLEMWSCENDYEALVKMLTRLDKSIADLRKAMREELDLAAFPE